MESVIKILLPVYLILFFGFVFVLKSYRVWKQTGVNPYRLGKSDNAHDTIGKAMSFTWGICIIIVGLHSFSDQAYEFLTPIAWLNATWLTIIGLVILTLSLGWVFFAQAQMVNAWRVGIDPNNPTSLVQTGVFARSRNPIFLGMLGMLLGLLLTLPNAISLLAFGLGVISLQIQVRLEEEHLLKTCGNTYQAYINRVPRWL
jgi:protein-S-isoprenylcysteine O-methyltransferase Ste14